MQLKKKRMVAHLNRCSDLLMQALQHNDSESMEMESSSACCPQDNKNQSPYQPIRDVQHKGKISSPCFKTEE